MYAMLNVLIVTDNASYVSTQVSGDTPEQAWVNAISWAAGCLGAWHKDITTASPVFIKQDGMTMEQHTVGSCIRAGRTI